MIDLNEYLMRLLYGPNKGLNLFIYITEFSSASLRFQRLITKRDEL